MTSNREYVFKPEYKEETNSPGFGEATVQVDGLINENTSRHHTRDYENGSLVLRRGETFKLELTFREMKFSEILETVLLFTLDSTMEESNGFSEICKIEESIDDSKWGMVIIEKDQQLHKLVVEINIPVDVIIGRYVMDVIAPSWSNSTLFTQFGIIVLFNPWNKDDEVYLGDEQLRQEYVLNDTGIIYRGYAKHGPEGIEPKHWNFGQFEENVLDCVLLLLKKEQTGKGYFLKTLRKRNSAVWISRRLSAVLNVQDEHGLLVGNWSNNYDEGQWPGYWRGSVEIFDQYFETGLPVMYGQCWVFSGVMTTALRSLGIPCRSVTNFLSAHDTDGTMTIDVFVDEDGETVNYLSGDSIWNYHVWNEIWTKRKDLPGDSYDGWQAVDSTPQEESADLFQMGPAPLKAVKEGEIFAGFDTGFVFGEVNADCVQWLVKKPDKKYVVSKLRDNKPCHVGRFISTKMVGKDEREDITHLYKYPEKSPEERKAFTTAYSFGKGPQKWIGELNMEKEGIDITIDLNTKPATIIQNGASFSCIITIQNTSNGKVTVNLTGVINSVLYNGGHTRMLIKREKMTGIVIEAGESINREVHIKPEEYLAKLTDSNCFKFVVVAKVQETGKHYVDNFTFQLFDKPCIDIKFPKTELKVGELSKVEVSFTNPLPITLSNIIITVEGAGLSKTLKIHVSGDVSSGEKKTVTFDITPRKPGSRKLLVDIQSRQSKIDFKSFATVNVAEPLTG